MHRVILYSLIYCSFAAPSQLLSQPAPEIKYAGMAVEFPRFETINNFTIFRDTVHFYYQGNMVLYALPYTHETFKNGVSVDLRKSFEYLMVEQNTQKGLYFPSLNDTGKCKWLLKDSVLASRNIKDYKVAELLTYDSLINRIITSDSELIEKYIPLNTYKDKLIDTTDLFFSAGLRDIPYSFSPFLESIHSRSLSKIRMVYNPRYYPEMKSDIPRQVWTYELFQQSLPELNKKEILSFFLIAKELFKQKELK